MPLRATSSPSSPSWFVYLLQCKDGSLYTGITTDPRRRFLEHQSGRGARYTRARGALAMVWLQEVEDQGTALRLEAALKRQHVKTKQILAARTGVF